MMTSSGSPDDHEPGGDGGDEGPCKRCPHSRRCGSSFIADTHGQIERRDVAKGLATLGGLAALGSLAAPLASLTRVFEQEDKGPIYVADTPLVDAAGERITEDSLSFGESMTVFPEGNADVEGASTLLVRFPQEDYGDRTIREYLANGYAAYSKVCTHAGCLVSGFEESVFECPCHFGRFDALSGAIVVSGPPPRPLPQLPITFTAEGYLVADDTFEAPIGPGKE